MFWGCSWGQLLRISMYEATLWVPVSTNIQTHTWDVPSKTNCCLKKKKGNGADWIPGPDMPIKVGMD